MPTFSNRLPPEGKHRGYELLRTPETGTITGIITCDNLIVCDTHFWHGRTMPCERIVTETGDLVQDTNCPACVAKQSWRTHAYVSAYSGKTGVHFLYECTAMAAKQLADYYDNAGTLRGCGFQASRPKGRKNAKVVIVTTPVNLAKVNLPEAPDVARALAVIWRLPETAVTTDPSTRRTDADEGSHSTPRPTLSIAQEPIKEMRDQPANQPAEPTTMDAILAGEPGIFPSTVTPTKRKRA
jgi:hypothetical protein